jgi:hypothetical protein
MNGEFIDWRCKSCGQVEYTASQREKPNGWYRVAMGGESHATAADCWPGVYCCLDCLCVAVMRPYGVDRNAVLNWLAGGVPA